MDASDDELILPASPLGHKLRRPKSPRKSSIPPPAVIEKRPSIPNPLPLPSDNEDASETETEGEDMISTAPSGTTASEIAGEEGSEATDDSEEDEEYAEATSEDEGWEESLAAKTPKARKRVIASPSPTTPSPSPSPEPKRKPTKAQSTVTPQSSRVSKLVRVMDDLQIDGDGFNDSMFVPKKKMLRRSESSTADGDDSQDEAEALELPTVKKKKRCDVLLYFRRRGHF